MTLPPYITRDEVHKRLQEIFPQGTPNRIYCSREMAASTVFAALYIGAVEGSGHRLAPIHVYRMTEERATRDGDSDRMAFYRKQAIPIGERRWYEDNTREPIRDETLRDGLVAIGAVLVDGKVPTTSGKGRYELKKEFAALFDPALTGVMLAHAIASWQKTHLSAGALARVSIMAAGAAGISAGVLVTLPNMTTRTLAPGPSAPISKAVIEEFAPRFLATPAVLWLSESGNKVVAQDDKLASKIGLKIDASKDLPDVILADIGPVDPLIVFVEVVATDGAVTARRQAALLALTDAAGFARKQICFVSAYADRENAGFKKTIGAIAWGTFAWFMSEPRCLICFRDGLGTNVRLEALIEGIES